MRHEKNKMSPAHRVETRSMNHTIEYHYDDDMHRDMHEGNNRGMSMEEVERQLKTGGGRMARQNRQREALDDTTYGKIPPVPGRIDS